MRVVCRCGPRPEFAACSRLVNAVDDDSTAGDGGIADGNFRRGRPKAALNHSQ